MIRLPHAVVLPLAIGLGLPFAWLQLEPLPVVPTDVQLPGTQPLEVGTLPLPTQCDNCHGGFDAITEPDRPWRGSMMAQAGRDPLFWATMAVAEQDFPGSGDLCLRCHAPRGWIEGRSSPTNGSALTSGDEYGVECAVCHKVVDPDQGEHAGVQNPPYVANDGGTPPVGYYGSGMMVLSGGNTRLGPYANPASPHASLQSLFHRASEQCGTCHDVSNPVVGDLAHDNGSEVPLAPGTFSGVPGSPVAGKAAFNNFPYAYGVVERTFSEHQASAFATLRVQDYATLPPELQRGILATARQQALLAGTQGNHEDGATRYFSCQTCHMLPIVGKGAAQNSAPVRTDIGRHDLNGGNTWVPSLIAWADQHNALPIGGGMSAGDLAALGVGAARARMLLRQSAALDVDVDTLRVVNLTGHKLITGYPDGRRMWLRVNWYDRAGNVVRTDGEYGTLNVTVQGAPFAVETLLQPNDPNLHVYHARFGLTQQWASQLLGLGVAASLPLEYDRATGAVATTLGQLAAQPAGTKHESFRFVLGNTVIADTRIPPYGMQHDTALARNTRPVPATLFGDPGPGGTYRHYDEIALAPPAGAVRARFELLYQTTSWEYVQFLLLANDGTDPFLGATGQDLFDGWRATGMSSPETMATTAWCRLPGTGDDLRLDSGVAGQALDRNCAKTVTGGQTARFRLHSPGGTLAGEIVAFVFEIYPAAGPMPAELLPGLQLDRADYLVPVVLAAAGNQLDIPIPPGYGGSIVRAQGLAISQLTLSGFLGTSAAHDVALQ